MRLVWRALGILLGCGCVPAFADCTTNSYTQPAPSQFLASFAPNCVFTYAPTLPFINDKIGVGSYTFGSSDFYQQTNRSNGGAHMTDTLPATGLVTGTVVQIRNSDSSATDTVTPTTYTIEDSSSDTIAPGQTVEYVFDASLTTPQWWKVLNSGAQATFATTVGNTANNIVQMANTGIGVKDSGIGIGTSGANLCALNSNCIFSGSNSFNGTVGMNAMSTFTTTQFANNIVSGTTQRINDQEGTSWVFSGTPWNGQSWELSAGTTTGQPVTGAGPTFKISRTEAVTAATCGNNAVDNTCNAALLVASVGTNSDGMQNVGLFAIAQSSQTGCGNCNTVAGRFRARITGTNPLGKASAASFIAENNGSFTGTMSGLKGFELDDNNNTGTNCPSVSYSGAGTCDGGEWLVSQGANTAGPAIHIGNGGIAWDEGITINNDAVSNYAFNDQSSSATSVNIAGTHATAAINVASSAGSVQLNNNTLAMGGTGQITGVGSIQLPVSQAAPVIYAGSDTTTGFYQSASGVWKFASGGSDIVRWNSSGTSIGGYVMVGSVTNLNLGVGEIGFSKRGPSLGAPGATGAKIEVVCGTSAGTAKIIAYAGTSNSASTILDNIGGGVTGC